MRISASSYDKMNSLMAACFDANAIFDNIAYNLDYHYLNKIANVVHLHVAHEMPVLADLFSDELLMLSVRPVRLPIGHYEEEYTDLSEIFLLMSGTFLKLRQATRELIESADMDGDDEIRIFGEDFLKNHLEKFIKQTEEWYNASKVLTPTEMNIHINDYTHFIAL